MSPQSYKSVMKFTIDGRPSMCDIHDYFSFLISQISFGTHKYMFRSYPLTFTSEEAVSKLGSLNISTDANARENLNLEKDMAKALIQQFLWSRLIEYAVDPHNRSYRDKGIWRLKSKGLCVLQDFCLKSNRVDLLSFFKNCVYTPSVDPMFLIHVNRLLANDRMNSKRKYISALFAIMVASLPLRDEDDSLRARENVIEPMVESNYYSRKVPSFTDHSNDIMSSKQRLSRQSSISSASTNLTSTSSFESNLITDYFPHLKVYANDLLVHSTSSAIKSAKTTSIVQQKVLLRNLRPSPSNKFKMRSVFTSHLCCEWLVGYCTVASNDEAESIATEFLDLGWITFFDDKKKNKREIESSKSTMLKLTGAGMKVIIDFSLESHENFQQQRRKDEALSEGKKYSIVSLSSVNNQDESKSLFSTFDESFYSKHSHSPSTDYIDAEIDYSVCMSTYTKKSIKSCKDTDYTTNNFTSYNTKCTNKPVFDHDPYDMNMRSSYKATSREEEISNDKYKDNNSMKLKMILNEPNLRSLFREFLEANLCAENLDFWVDFQKLRSECHDDLNNLVALSPKKQKYLIKDAYMLWNTYLAPDASRELNINHTLRENMANEMSNIATVVNTGVVGTNSVPTVIISMPSAHENLSTIFTWFGKVDKQIFKLMASDSIPKFIRTLEYKNLTGRTHSPPQEIRVTKSPTTSSMNNSELDNFPPPPQRKLKETLFL